jgi:hypothetical protein
MKTLSNAADREEILRRLQSINGNSTRLWGTMSEAQMLCHLADAFSAALGEREVGKTGGVASRTLIKWIALYAPMQWPKGVPTMPEVDQLKGSGTKPAGFDADHASLVALFERFAGRDPASIYAPHPGFGPLTHDQWQRWGYLHMDHHLRQFGS